MIGVCPCALHQSLMVISVVGRLGGLASRDLVQISPAPSDGAHISINPLLAMRLGCFVLVVVLALAGCCSGITNAEGAAMIKNPETDSNRASSVTVRRHLKGSKTKAALSPDDEERGGLTSIKSLLGKVPNKLKTALKTNPSQAKALGSKSPGLKGFLGKVGNKVRLSIDDIKDFMAKEKHPAVSVLISLLKMLAVVGVISVTSGYLIYTFGN
jgi:hypothetical protein